MLYTDATQYAHYVFNTVKHKQRGKLNFEEFLETLSRVARGSVQEKLSWVFALYDVDGDGRISRAEMLAVVQAVYELLGRAAVPPVSQTSAKDHVDRIFHCECRIVLYVSADGRRRGRRGDAGGAGTLVRARSSTAELTGHTGYSALTRAARPAQVHNSMPPSPSTNRIAELYSSLMNETRKNTLNAEAQASCSTVDDVSGPPSPPRPTPPPPPPRNPPPRPAHPPAPALLTATVDDGGGCSSEGKATRTSHFYHSQDAVKEIKP
ncbi:Kv channel-interacting protein 4 [Papilio xuthus]|uniref:Kv channel-interacting protein 4 n=1 Tax=Papilio xuthus TaxID=66420 RepID=A0A194Q2S7_PAPXU|nr:Kv channel-interacting protein 4 [Papilio xuthus]